MPWRKRAKKGMGVASAYLSMSAALSVEVGDRCWMVESILTSGEIVAFVLLGGGRSKEVTLSPIGRRLARRSTMVYSCPLGIYSAALNSVCVVVAMHGSKNDRLEVKQKIRSESATTELKSIVVFPLNSKK